ncbi:hypothetical protein CRUP_028105 [Coryphaenoides rupestris]|nr:hypothetical protein CRUP_028105 [Coryphaenoides rupestris]
MAESATSLKGLRAQLAAAAQAQADERRSLTENSPGPTPTSTAAKPQGPRPVIDGAALRIDERLRVAKERREEAERQQVIDGAALRIDERLRVAKERREEAERQQAVRDSQIVERERKAKLQVERQMEERQKKLDEQRRKEEQKRSAVEEKRKLKQEEEKEHYEAVMRRTLERSQRAEQRQKRWSWGGLSTDSDGGRAVDKRSTSTMNLKQSAEAGISKRLSSSSATLIKTPDKSAKRRSASCQRLPSIGVAPQAKEDCKKPQVEKPGPSMKKRSSSLTRVGGGRAQTPAKPNKGATDDQASASPLQPPVPAQRGPLRSRSIDRQKSGMTASLSADGALDPSLRPPSPQPNNVAAASSAASKPPPIQKPALTPTGPPTLRKRDSNPSTRARPAPPLAPPPAPPPSSSGKTKDKDKDDSKAMVGTSSKEEAAKMLAENRRLAREQKEREELLRIQREEEERLRKEEEQRLAEEARLKREEEAKLEAEERRKREEEEAVLAEEERVRQAAEEALRQAEQQREREEAEARAAEEAERVRVERERVLQQNQQERMERKKRIEEIMKRTRKGDEKEKRDDAKDDQDDADDDVDEINCETKEDDVVQQEDVAVDTDDAVKEEELCVASDEPIGEESEHCVASDEPIRQESEHCVAPDEPMREEREPPVGSVNGRSDADDKENNNGISSTEEESQAVSPVPKSRLVEGSEFLNEEDASKAGLVPGLNGKPGPWSFEELIDLNVHSKSRPLLQAEDCNQGLIHCDGAADGPRDAFQDNGPPGVKSMHSSAQPLEAMAEV